MKLKTVLIFVLFSLFSVCAFAAPDNNAANDMNMPTKKEQDGAILSWLIVLNKNEIAAANLALDRKVNPKVGKFAHFMIKEHSENLKQTIATGRKMHIKAITTDQAIKLHTEGENELDKLKSMDKQEFQKAYIDAMVKGHTEALDKLESDIHTVRNPTLKRQLQMTAKHVAMHLKMAKAIQKEFQD